ncbi:MAG: hypothetical protein KC646_03145 [Candidatus Cloacimonetes bacterium]|nr:hypothetical protein [Candidatus Cloacimonadota bacterium]
MKILITLMVGAVASLATVDAYNFRSKKAPKVQSHKNYQGQSSRNHTKRRVPSRHVSRNNHQVFNESAQNQGGFGFEGFNTPPSRQETPKIQKLVSRSRNMSRGPQRRNQTRQIQQRLVPKKKSPKIAAMPKQQMPPKIQGYKGEYYGGGNALFQVDPGLIGRWNKPGLSAKNKF